LSVVTAESNLPPRVVSTPVVTTTAGEPYAYDLRAKDPEGDPLVWDIRTGLRGMSIDAALGTIRWDPEADQVGAAEVVVEVVDGQGGRATQHFTVAVRGANLPPAIVSVPPTLGSVGQVYNYVVRTTDPDGDPPRFRLTAFPAGMMIDA